MKKLTKLFALSIVMLSFAAGAFAQGVTASASATATIITPIAIAKNVDMNFGNVAVNASAGTVLMTPAGVRSVTGGCTLPTPVGTVTAASFTVTGLAAATYTITLPAAATTITAVTNMTVDTWTSTPTPTGTLTGGTQTLTVGATLHVAGSQLAGVYTSATPFDVTVNYN
jgi:hypothetical protein